MNKARRKSNKPSGAKKLARESFILSSARLISSRAVRVFENGFLSPVITSVETVDEFANEKITKPIFKKLELRKNILKPARNRVSKFISNNGIYKHFVKMRNSLLNSSVRSVGLFFLIFGIYASAIFFAKHYMAIGEANTNDLVVSALTVVAGLLMSLFGDKSLLNTLANGRIIGSLLSGVLGVNDTSLNKAPPKTTKLGIGVSFLLGSLSGVLTMFFPPAQILSFIGRLIVVVSIFNIPELGVMLTAVLVAVLSAKTLSSLVVITLLSYLFKCLRLKRNCRFGTADILALVSFFVMLVACSVSGDEVVDGEHYLLCFAALYFPVKNLICSERLFLQSFNALCMGGFLGMCSYILGEFAPVVNHQHFRQMAMTVSQNAPDADVIAVMAAVILPFAICSFSSFGTKGQNLLFLLFALTCAFISDSIAFYGIIAVSVFAYIASAYKAPFGSVVAALVSVPPVFVVLNSFTFSKVVEMSFDKPYDLSLFVKGEANNLWQGMESIGGILSVLLFAVVIVLVLQRIFSVTVLTKSNKITRLCGTVASSVVLVIISAFLFNLYSDLRMICMLWFILGICGSAYKIYYKSRDIYEEV